MAGARSSYWDGRFAIVVAADIAVYAPGNARPTGGAGAVAMLIGPKASIEIEPFLRATHMENAYDFYKPIMDVEYPVVDGKLSIDCYLRSIDICYDRFRKRADFKDQRPFTLDSADFAIFHSPFHKLVQRSYARLAYNDFLRHPDLPHFSGVADQLKPYLSKKREETYADRDLEKVFLKLSEEAYKRKVLPSSLLPKHIGNTYTASLYTGLASLLVEKTAPELLVRCGMSCAR
jgi:hydroxymethylglutaryl-CoA synthase